MNFNQPWNCEKCGCWILDGYILLLGVQTITHKCDPTPSVDRFYHPLARLFWHDGSWKGRWGRAKKWAARQKNGRIFLYDLPF